MKKDKELEQRLRAWTEAAEAGDVSAMEALGAYYDELRPESMSSRERLGRWLGAAAKAGSVQAAFRLANAMAWGRSTPWLAGIDGTHEEVYLGLLRQAMEGGVPMATYTLARKAAFPACFELMGRAACQGVPDAVREVAMTLFDLGLVERSEPWLRRFIAMEEAAAQAGKSPYTQLVNRFVRLYGPDEDPGPFLPDPGALWRLGVCRERAGDIAEAVRLFRRVAAGEGLANDGYVPLVPMPGNTGWEKPARRMDAESFFGGAYDFKGEAQAHLLWLAEQGLIESPDFSEDVLGRQGRWELELLRHPERAKERFPASVLACLERLPEGR